MNVQFGQQMFQAYVLLLVCVLSGWISTADKCFFVVYSGELVV